MIEISALGEALKRVRVMNGVENRARVIAQIWNGRLPAIMPLWHVQCCYPNWTDEQPDSGTGQDLAARVPARSESYG